jgi:zinc transporter ZupT
VASGGFLFATATTHLLPELFSNTHYSSITGFCVALGFLMQLFLEQFSQGIEHGHLHTNHPNGHCHQHDHTQTQQPNIYGGLLLALLIHNFLEGIPLGSSPATMLQNPLFVGIIAHQAPTAFALMMLLHEAHINMRRRMLALVVFAVATPLGAYLGYALPTALQNSEAAVNIILALVTGSFLHISTTIIHEADSNDNHKFNIIKLATASAGAAAILLF